MPGLLAEGRNRIERYGRLRRGEIRTSIDQRAVDAVSTSVLLAGLLVLIWLAALGHGIADRRQAGQRLDRQTLAFKERTVRLVEDRMAELDRLRRAWPEDEDRGLGRPPALSELLMKHLPGLSEIQGIDSEGRVVWLALGDDTRGRAVPDRSMLQRPRIAPTFLFARRSLEPQTTPALPLGPKQWGFVTFFPKEGPGGGIEVLGAVFRFRDLFNHILAQDDYSQLDLELIYDDVIVWQSPRAAEPAIGETASRDAGDVDGLRTSSFQIHSYQYRLRVRSQPGSQPSFPVHWPQLAGAHLLALLAAWAYHRLRRSRAELHAHSHLMDGVFSNLPVTAFSIGPDGSVERSFGKAAGGLGLSSGGGETLDGFPALVRPLQRALAGESVHLEADLVTDVGESKTFELFLLHDEMRGGGVLGFAIDVSTRKWIEKALQSSEERYRRFFREAPFAYFAVDLNGRIEVANTQAAKLTGYSAQELSGMECSQLFAGSGFEPWAGSSGRAEVVQNHEVELLRADGSTFWGSLSVQPLRDDTELVGSGLIVLDITQRKLLQEQVRQSQKMEAVGRLAGGIAHDFNNLLTAIMGHARMALKRLGDESRPSQDLEEIQKACHRATTLVSQLLAFSRRQIVEPKVFGLNGLLRDMDPMLRRLTREEVELASHLAADLGHLRMDPGQMEQVIVNLVVNAQEAITGNGWVTIETDNYIPQGADQMAREPVEWVRLRVSDTGSGMSPEVQEHIFEPFFTTKEDLSGTGLGLATVYGIVVEQSSGQVLVDSEVGKGTTISILLPRVYEEIEIEEDPLPQAEPSLGHERILLVEDEEMVRRLAAEMLSSLGYDVIEAKNGLDALEVVRGREREIDLLLTDVVMPKMGGEKLFLELRDRHPELRVLYSSGYTESAVIHHGVKEGEVPFVHKPYTFDTLAQAVQSTLKR